MVGSEVLIATDDPDGPARLRRLADATGPSGALVLVRPSTVGATRSALAVLADRDEPVGVVGHAELTSPHLVDLLDDLLAGPGGRHLRAVATGWPADAGRWLGDVAVRRGLACLQQRGLALRLVGAGDPATPAAVAALEPDLEVLVDPPADDGDEGSGHGPR